MYSEHGNESAYIRVEYFIAIDVRQAGWGGRARGEDGVMICRLVKSLASFDQIAAGAAHFEDPFITSGKNSQSQAREQRH